MLLLRKGHRYGLRTTFLRSRIKEKEAIKETEGKEDKEQNSKWLRILFVGIVNIFETGTFLDIINVLVLLMSETLRDSVIIS